MLLLYFVPPLMKPLPRISPPKCWPKNWQPALHSSRSHLLYYWEGKLEQEYEVQMLLKTNLANQQALLDCLKSHHPYQTPELLVLPVVHGDNDYLSWLNASLR
jgi:uncharacterized protein involved in tolerance to divalent cations